MRGDMPFHDGNVLFDDDEEKGMNIAMIKMTAMEGKACTQRETQTATNLAVKMPGFPGEDVIYERS